MRLVAAERWEPGGRLLGCLESPSGQTGRRAQEESTRAANSSVVSAGKGGLKLLAGRGGWQAQVGMASGG